jgi:hypothetical protein
MGTILVKNKSGITKLVVKKNKRIIKTIGLVERFDIMVFSKSDGFADGDFIEMTINLN